MNITIEVTGHYKQHVQVPEDAVLIVDGVRFTAILLEEIIASPPPGLYSFHRAGDNIEVTRHHELEALVKAL